MNTPRTESALVLCNYGEYRVSAQFARQLETELNRAEYAYKVLRQDYQEALAEWVPVEQERNRYRRALKEIAESHDSPDNDKIAREALNHHET